MYNGKQQCIKVNIFIDEAPYIINMSVAVMLWRQCELRVTDMKIDN